MPAVDALRRVASETGGMTLIELLISMALGLLVSFGAFTLIELSTKQSTRVGDQVAANQLARNSDAYLESELESSCIQPGGQNSQTGAFWGPIQYGLSTPAALSSDASNLVFWTASDATAAPNTTYSVSGISYALHKVQFVNNTLVDTIWPVTSGTGPPGTSNPFGYGVSKTSTIGKLNGTGVITQYNSNPVFRYYSYSASYTLSATPLTLPLTTTTAPNIAAVEITYQVEGNPGDNTATSNNAQAAPYVVDDTVDLRLTSVQNPSANNAPYPCQ
jgi:hypothetical protein